MLLRMDCLPLNRIHLQDLLEHFTPEELSYKTALYCLLSQTVTFWQFLQSFVAGSIRSKPFQVLRKNTHKAINEQTILDTFTVNFFFADKHVASFNRT